MRLGYTPINKHWGVNKDDRYALLKVIMENAFYGVIMNGLATLNMRVDALKVLLNNKFFNIFNYIMLTF